MTFDADWMYWLILENYIPDITESPPDTYGGAELAYIRGLDTSTFEYSEVVHDAAQDGINTVSYPNTNLGNQLSSVAKLISGGLTIGLTIPTIPITDKILNKFDPIILPTEIPCSL